MSYDFKRLAEIDSVEEFPEGASVIIESEGSVKRCPADGLGGDKLVIEVTENMVETNRYINLVRVSNEIYSEVGDAFPNVAIKLGGTIFSVAGYIDMDAFDVIETDGKFTGYLIVPPQAYVAMFMNTPILSPNQASIFMLVNEDYEFPVIYE